MPAAESLKERPLLWLQGGEVAFVLGHEIAAPNCPEDYALADKIQTFWAAFAKHGDPNVGHELPAWPPYAEGAQLMTLDHVCSATPVVRAPLLDIHDVWLGRACDQLAAARL